MENVSEIKKEDGLNFILPTRYVLSEKNIKNEDVLIVIHLYYEDLIDSYLEYISNIPDGIHLLFLTSKEEVKNKINDYMKIHNKSYDIFIKCNRGRDVSGLLVAAREEILKYKYACFVHDKREKNEKVKLDAQHFSKCMWENLLGSSCYIENILLTLERNEELGLLLPPEPLSPNFSYFVRNTWGGNFEIAKSLARRLSLTCDLNQEKKPLSVGTAFWAKTTALKKLFLYEWKYEDFDEEPLVDDGTISHAIERIFVYVAQDAGYKSGIVMTDAFTGERLEYIQTTMTDAFSWMEKTQGIYDIARMYETFSLLDVWKINLKRYSDVYIYGAGIWGRRCKSILELADITVAAFLISNKTENVIDVLGVPVIEINEVRLCEKDAVIIAASQQNAKEIEAQLRRINPDFNNVFFFNN